MGIIHRFKNKPIGLSTLNTPKKNQNHVKALKMGRCHIKLPLVTLIRMVNC